jgi:hypothetical protein
MRIAAICGWPDSASHIVEIPRAAKTPSAAKRRFDLGSPLIFATFSSSPRLTVQIALSRKLYNTLNFNALRGFPNS